MFKSLLRTLPTLSGNFSICCKLEDYNKISSNDYETYIRNASILSLQDNQYNNEISINLANENHEFIISKYYKLYSNLFYKENYTYDKKNYQDYDKYQINSNNDGRNKDYEFGCKRLNYSYNGYQFNFYAPFYIDDVNSLPEYFLISIYMTDKLIKTIKVFIDKDNSENYLRKYLIKYCKKIDNKVIFGLPESKQATYFGINVKDGGFGQYVDNEFGKLYNVQHTINNFDYIICKGFERNHLIMKQVIPLSFSFNINDLFSEYEKKMFAYNKIKIIGRYYDKFNNGKDLYDFGINYTKYNCKYNKYENGNYSLDYGYDSDNNPINIMNVKYPSLNESKYIRYRFTNKIIPNYCRFKLSHSDDSNPYIINMSYAFSTVNENNEKYGEFPTIFKDIFPVSIVKNNNLILPIGTTNKVTYNEYDYFNYLKYEKLMSNFYSSWFNVLKNNDDIFSSLYNWSNVKNQYSYFNGVLYNFKNEDIDKFSLFIKPHINYISNNEAKNNIVNALYIFDTETSERTLDKNIFINLNNVTYNKTYKLDNFVDNIEVIGDIDLNNINDSYSLIYKIGNGELFNVSNLMKSDYYETYNDRYYNDIYFDLDNSLSYTHKLFDYSNSSDYIAINKNVIKDVNGDYILVDNYYNRNLYFKTKDIKQLIINHNFNNYNQIIEALNDYIDRNKIIGYELIKIDSLNNIFDKYGNIIFNNSNIDNIYITVKGSNDKTKLSNIIENIKNNISDYPSISLFRKIELLEKESLFNFLYKNIDIQNISYTVKTKDVKKYIDLFFNINLNILNDIVDSFGYYSDILPVDKQKEIVNDIAKKFYPCYKVIISDETISNEYLSDIDDIYKLDFIILIQEILRTYNWFVDILRNTYDQLNNNSLTLYNTTISCPLYYFLYYEINNELMSYNYVPCSINKDNDIITNYYTQNKKYINNDIYVDNYNINSLIYQYNKENNKNIPYITEDSVNYEIEEKYGEFLNIEHIKQYVEYLYNRENIYELNSNEKKYISIINNIYVKERIWINENNEFKYKDVYTVLSKYLMNLNKINNGNNENQKGQYKYLNDLFIVNTIYNGYENLDTDDPNVDPLYNEQYYKYSNDIFMNIVCSSYKNENNKFMLNLDEDHTIELSLVFKKEFIKLNDYLLEILNDNNYMYLYINNYELENKDNWLTEDITYYDYIEDTNNFISPLFKDIYLNDTDVDMISNLISKNKIINNKYINNKDNIFMYVDIYQYFRDYILQNSTIKDQFDNYEFINKYVSNEVIIDHIFDYAKLEWDSYKEDESIILKYENVRNIDIDKLFDKFKEVFKEEYDKRIQVNSKFLKEINVVFSDYQNKINTYFKDDEDYEEEKRILNNMFKRIDYIIDTEFNKNKNAKTVIKNFFDYKEHSTIDDLSNLEKLFTNTLVTNIINYYIDNIDDYYYRSEIIKNYIGIDLYSIYNTNNVSYHKIDNDDISNLYDNDKYELIESSTNLNILLDKETNKKYGFFIIDFEFDNTNNSLNINNQYDFATSFETINGKDINDNDYIYSIFHIINPFFKENIFKRFVTDNIDYIIFPNEFDISILYNSVKLNKDEVYKYEMLKDNDEDQLYESIIKFEKPKKIKLLRYFNYIEPLLLKTNVINDLWEVKFIKNNNYSEKYNILYKSNVNINKYNGIYLCNDYNDKTKKEISYDIINQYEYKHYNDNVLFNIPEEIIIILDTLLEYDDIIKYQTEEKTFEEFKKYINKVNKTIDDLNIILFLYNKYKVSYSSEQVKLDSTKSKKLYKISYKFNLK